MIPDISIFPRVEDDKDGAAHHHWISQAIDNGTALAATVRAAGANAFWV